MWLRQRLPKKILHCSERSSWLTNFDDFYCSSGDLYRALWLWLSFFMIFCRVWVNCINSLASLARFSFICLIWTVTCSPVDFTSWESSSTCAVIFLFPRLIPFSKSVSRFLLVASVTVNKVSSRSYKRRFSSWEILKYWDWFRRGGVSSRFCEYSLWWQLIAAGFLSLPEWAVRWENGFLRYWFLFRAG